ncbi:MAG: helix-turn-helix domain-containing protein, partial [Bacilli bacterium]
MEKSSNKSVLKTLDFLEFFIHKPQLSLGELVKLSGMPKTTVFRIMQTMEMSGFISRFHNGKQPFYQLGLKLLELGNLVSQRLEVRKVALPYMILLRDRVNEAVNLIVRSGDEAVYIEKV